MWRYAVGWLLLNLFSIICLAFYSMMEMASVSFNRVRLHYYISKGNKRAEWLNYLLQHPSRLFGTTLIGVNVAMVAGSECAREFHSAIGLSPDLAPISQVILVIIFGELSPMFAARHYAEHVAMLGVPIVYASARILAPFIILLGWLSNLTSFFIRKPTHHGEIYLTKEELQKILEEKPEEPAVTDTQDFNVITQNIFHLRQLSANDMMSPLSQFPSLPSNATIAQMKNIVKRTNADFVPIYHLKENNIVGIAFPRDLVRITETKRVRDHARPPWFVTEETPPTRILQQFQHNNQTVAVILDNKGKANGIVTLDDLLAEIFGEARYKPQAQRSLFIMERTFPGDMLVKDFNQQFGVILDRDVELTLSELMERFLGHPPEEGDSVYIEPFELSVKETTLLEVKKIVVKSRAT